MGEKFIPSSSNPSFCFITPTSYLEDFATQSNTHLALAHLVHEDPFYAAFYKACSDRGDFVMLDNSAYEKKFAWNPGLLVELGHKCGAHAIVLPDYPFQAGQVTIDAAKKYIPLFKDAGFECFFVPQSTKGDTADWIKTYEWGANHPDISIIGMSILGIPNSIPAINPAYARVVMTSMLIDRGVFNYNKSHHYLGLNAGPKLEIPSLISMNALTTIDSSGPVYSAILGHEYTETSDSLLACSKPMLPVQFDLPMTKDAATLKRIQHNVNLTKNLFAQSEKHVWYAQE